MNDKSGTHSTGDGSLSQDGVYEAMEPFEPYTLDELTERLDARKGPLWSSLRKLARTGKIRKKESNQNRRIWIREPPAKQCASCGSEFQIKPLHPVMASMKFCPRCGTQLE
jgi:hypothetical protein